MKRIMISAMSSGSGKTVLTCGLLSAFKRRGVAMESFKCGPDYIDPMFHERAMGIKCRNLDIFLQGEEKIIKSLSKQKAELAIIEGAMGYYDGAFGTEKASAWETAKLAKTPVILAIKPKGTGVTLAAQIKGMLEFREESRIVGAVLMDCSERLFEYMKEIIERETPIKVFGYVPNMEEAKLESRHLGLVTAKEIEDFEQRFEHIAAQIEKTVDLNGILEIAYEVPCSKKAEEKALEHETPCSKIAVAKDEAFCFYYSDSIESLSENGAEIIFFSPIHDSVFPDCDGLYLGGGYPELYAKKLSENAGMREQIRTAVNSGLPVIAECGGFLYLQSELEDVYGNTYPMAGVFSGKGYKTEHLQRFGYCELVSDEDSMLFQKGEAVPAHEFHYWDCSENGNSLAAKKAGGKEWKCGFISGTMYAGFPHIHMDGKICAAKRFVNAAAEYRQKKEKA